MKKSSTYLIATSIAFTAFVSLVLCHQHLPHGLWSVFVQSWLMHPPTWVVNIATPIALLLILIALSVGTTAIVHACQRPPIQIDALLLAERRQDWCDLGLEPLAPNQTPDRSRMREAELKKLGALSKEHNLDLPPEVLDSTKGLALLSQHRPWVKALLHEDMDRTRTLLKAFKEAQTRMDDFRRALVDTAIKAGPTHSRRNLNHRTHDTQVVAIEKTMAGSNEAKGLRHEAAAHRMSDWFFGPTAHPATLVDLEQKKLTQQYIEHETFAQKLSNKDYQALQNIDEKTLQLQLIKGYVLGVGDMNHGNILFTQKNDAWQVMTIDFEEMMPASNDTRIRSVPMRFVKKAPRVHANMRVVAMDSALLGLSQAKQKFSLELLERLRQRLDLTLVDAFHRAHPEFKFSAAQKQAQMIRVHALRCKIDHALKTQKSFSPRALYDTFYQQGQARGCFHFMKHHITDRQHQFYGWLNRVSVSCIGHSSAWLKTFLTTHQKKYEALNKSLAANQGTPADKTWVCEFRAYRKLLERHKSHQSLKGRILSRDVAQFMQRL